MSLSRLMVIAASWWRSWAAAVEWAAGARARGFLPSATLRIRDAVRVGPVPVGRLGMYGFWWWVGWHLFAR